MREFLDVRAVVEVHCRLLECPAAVGETVNICTGRGIALREVIAALEAETGHQMDIWVNARFVRANEVRQLVGSPRKLESLIGTVAETPLTKTIRDMLASR